MGPINKTLALAKFSFEQQTTQAAISKLAREFDRLTAAQDETDVRDFSINFSTTDQPQSSDPGEILVHRDADCRG